MTDLRTQLEASLGDAYVTERELGGGGMSRVFIATERALQRRVVIKVMASELAGAVSLERFRREIALAATLQQANIVPLLTAGDAGGVPYFVMPYVDGESLRARLAQGEVPIAECVGILRDVARALAYAHARHIVHRDIKPDNVLLSGGTAMVTDFGVAKAMSVALESGAERLTATGLAIGTPAYMAPEQAAGDPNVDHRADIYAFGCLAYELLVGAAPFAGRSAAQMISAHLTDAPEPVTRRRPNVPPALAALVAQCLEKNPADRPQNADRLITMLDQVPLASSSGARSSPDATTLALGHRTPQPAARRRRAGGIIAGVMALIAAAGFWSMRNRTVTPTPESLHTIAVLPFVNIGGDVADEYFSDGMTDELAHALAKLPGVRIAGRSSSYAYKGKSVPAQEIGRVLDVAALVEGTVRRAGDRLRVTTELVSTTDGKVLWDSVYESRSSDVFGVQDQFTRAVVAALTPTLGARPAQTSVAEVGRGTKDLEAYELYLKGRYYWLNRGPQSVSRSIDYYHQAIARDPSFARAHAGLALAYHVLTVFTPDPRDSVPALVAASAERAMALDSTLADAQIARAVNAERHLRVPEAISAYRRAIALEPSNGYAHHSFGFFLLTLGRTDEAISELTRATQLDPLAKSAGTALSTAFSFERRGADAVAAARRVLAIDSNFALGYQTLGLAQVINGQPDSAVVSLERSRQLAPERAGRVAWTLFATAAAGKWSDAERIRGELRRAAGDRAVDLDVAFAELIFGNREPMVRALTTLEGQRAWNDRYRLGCNPMLDPLWSDKRFQDAMRTLTIEPCPFAKPWGFGGRRTSSSLLRATLSTAP